MKQSFSFFFICLFVSFYFAFLKILQPMTRYQQVCSHVPFIHLSLGWIMHLDYKRKKSCQRVRMLTIRFKPFLSMKITLQHSFIVKHITHWFWYDNIYHLWNLYLQKEKKKKKKGRKTRKLLILCLFPPKSDSFLAAIQECIDFILLF